MVNLLLSKILYQILISELGLNNFNKKTSPYNAVDKILSSNTSFLKINFYLEVKKIPNVYSASKSHKNLIKAKFIFGWTKCSVDPLSKAVIAPLKLTEKKIES